MMPIINLDKALERYIINNVSAVLGDSASAALNVITRLTAATSACDHGSIVILSEQKAIEEEAHRLTTNNRGIYLKNTVPLMITSQKADISSVVRMSSIDGAILADFDGNCYAFGVILDGRVSSPGNPDRGSRFNSTKTFVESKMKNEKGESIPDTSPFIGIVRSEDGMVDILWGG